MDTSVAVDYPEGNSLGLPDRVINIGLMADRKNYLIASGFIIIIGLVFVFMSKPRTESSQIAATESEYKKCPQCAELIKREAEICRFCNYKFIDPTKTRYI
jgi:hypothetical protein